MARISVPSNLGLQGRVKVVGLREWAQKLAELGHGMLERGCVQAMGVGANVMRDAVKRFAPVLQRPDPRRSPGTLRDAIHAMRSRNTRFTASFVVGVKLLSQAAISKFKGARAKAGKRWSGKFNPNDPFYGPILELGKTQRTRHPYLKPGFDASSHRAIDASFEKLRQYTMAEMIRLGARR